MHHGGMKDLEAGLPKPPPEASLGELIRSLTDQVGEQAVVGRCVALLDGEDRESHLDVLPWLTGLEFEPGAATRDPARWKPFWPRAWGARGLLYVWDDRAEPSVVAGLAPPVEPAGWRVAEMCLKVISARRLSGAGDQVAEWAEHRLPRVRVQAVRAMTWAGDTEHVEVIRAATADPEPQVRRQATLALERMGRRLDLPPDPSDLQPGLR